jgi:calmodulin
MSHIVSAARKLERDSKNEIFERLEVFFKEADKDDDGFLTIAELTRTIRRYGYKGGEAEIRKFFNMADTSGDAKVSLDEYLSVMKKAPSLKHSEAAMRRVFEMFDKDGNGSIDRDELRQVFAELGNYFPESEMQRMMAIADADDSGSLEYEEFINIVLGRKKARSPTASE